MKYLNPASFIVMPSKAGRGNEVLVAWERGSWHNLKFSDLVCQNGQCIQPASGSEAKHIMLLFYRQLRSSLRWQEVAITFAQEYFGVLLRYALTVSVHFRSLLRHTHHYFDKI